MLITQIDPGEWLHFIERKENQGLSLIEIKEKYRDEKILFENYITNFQQQNLIISQNSAAGGEKSKSVIIDYGVEFVTKWVIPNNNFELKIGTGVGVYLFDIDWGDGTVDENINTTPSHTYVNGGEYIVKISGAFPHLKMANAQINSVMRQSLQLVLNWGNEQWADMDGMFEGCSNLLTLPNTAPDLTAGPSMTNAFNGCSNFRKGVKNWDVSAVTKMDRMFRDCIIFNEDIGGWDTSNVTDMSIMFFGASRFNQYIGGWDVSNVTLMNGMFGNTGLFNQNISSWDVSGVTDMNSMFGVAYNFNQPIGIWDVSGVTDMNRMFILAPAFNQDIGNWNTSNVTDMSLMFFQAGVFNQNIGGWDVSALTSAPLMFSVSGMTTANYDLLLQGWVTSNRLANTVFSTDLTFSAAASTSRTTIINTPWTLTDGGLVP